MRAIQRVAVIGSSGQLGNDLTELFKDLEVTGLTHADILVEDLASVERALDRAQADLVINTAAYHHVANCETHQREALLINALGVHNVAQACARRKTVFATVSTDYVFDGTKGAPYSERDEPHPVSVYGVSKLAGEMLAASAAPEHYIFRTSGLFGKLGSKSKGYTFIDKILRHARDGAHISVVNDLIFSPSYTKHVAKAMRAIVERAPFGIYHVTNTGSCTWHDFAVEAIAAAGLKADVADMRSTDWNDGVRRPPNSSLGHDAMLAAGLDDLLPWQDAVGEYLKERSFTGTPLR